MQHASSEMSPAHTWRIQLKHGDLVEPPSSDVVQGRVSWTSYSVAGRLLLSKSRERLLAPEGVLVIPARRAAHYSAGLYCAATSQMAKSYSIHVDWVVQRRASHLGWTDQEMVGAPALDDDAAYEVQVGLAYRAWIGCISD